MTDDLTAEAVAQCWGDVTNLEQVFVALRDQLGLVPALRALGGILEIQNETWMTQRLAAAVAALDEVRHER
jgi:hypothetical protein